MLLPRRANPCCASPLRLPYFLSPVLLPIFFLLHCCRFSRRRPAKRFAFPPVGASLTRRTTLPTVLPIGLVVGGGWWPPRVRSFCWSCSVVVAPWVSFSLPYLFTRHFWLPTRAPPSCVRRMPPTHSLLLLFFSRLLSSFRGLPAGGSLFPYIQFPKQDRQRGEARWLVTCLRQKRLPA